METAALLQLKNLLGHIYPLPALEWEAFAAIWKPCTAKRKTILTHAGQTEKYLYFVIEGIQRVYYHDDQDREATIVFTYAPSFSGVADSFLTQQPSRFYAETLTPSSFLRTSFIELNECMQQHRQVEHLIRLLTNGAFSGILERMIALQCFSAEEKFSTLLKRSPHLLHLIPHKYIASYIGIDATNFSKLLARVRI